MSQWGKSGRQDDEFEKGFSRLNHAINSHSSPPRDTGKIDSPTEKRMKQWIKQTEEYLEQLRRHRKQRLSESGYDFASERDEPC
ncbi:MAG: hypothetical protein U9Q23_04845 [Candidatus Bipolaricaulota bacterium]|nr:hypothetical protein [Candidatus Bipolaricaulota bacterium]